MFAMVDWKGGVWSISARGNHGEFSLSPNGRFLATRIFAINDDIWIYDTTTGTPVRLTFEPMDGIYPQWSADGTRIAFGTRTGTIFWKPSDGSGQRQELFEPWSAEYDVMPDGEHFVFGLGPQPSATTHYNVVLNWFAELKRKRANR